MRVKTVVDEDFTNYKKPAMFIGTISCSGKCCIESGIPLSVCQNDGWRSCAPIETSAQELCKRYLHNPISQAIVFGGLEPFEQYDELREFVHALRVDCGCVDDIVIYTGYYPPEVEEHLKDLSRYKNIIVKFGRFVPNTTHIYDELLGVELASNNQFTERIS